MKFSSAFKLAGLGLAVFLVGGRAEAGETLAAVAANFKAPAEALAASFHQSTGDMVKLSFGPSQGFLTQISHGATFDVFLSADSDRPAQAESGGYAVAGTRFTYAIGQLVLWSKNPALVDAQGAVLRTAGFTHIAIADPKLAPYGAAAVETMKKLGVWDGLQSKLVTGNSIGQAYQFASTGNADLGFVALSQVIDEKAGSRWMVPRSFYSPIVQQAVLLKTGAANPVAKAFLAYLKSPAATSIILKYGYRLPK